MRWNTVLVLGCLAIIVFSPVIFGEDRPGALTDETGQRVKNAVDKGVHFLRAAQNAQGHWDDPGLTAMALAAILRCHRKYGPQDGPWVRKPIAYLVACQKEDGGIYIDQLAAYNTSVAILAFTSQPWIAEENREVIERAKKFLLKLQCDEEEGYTPEEDYFYGGIGYGGDERPDLSNTHFAMEALREAGVPSDDPAFQKAIVFLQRCQNRSETNDQEWAGNDGGFVYYPGSSYAGEQKLPGDRRGYRSYGSMTYAGIKSYIYADLKKDDPRVRAAYEWIQGNYDLTQNPGVGQQGLYYYYHTFAKTLALLGDPVITDQHQAQHNWREDLAKAILARQLPDGSWKNVNPRWWECDPRLATAYAVLALSHCLQ